MIENIIEEEIYLIKFEIEKLIINEDMDFEAARKLALKNYPFASFAMQNKRLIVDVINSMVFADLQPMAKNVIKQKVYDLALKINEKKHTRFRRWFYFKTSMMI